MHSKDWRYRARGTPARSPSPGRANVACTLRLRQRQSFGRAVITETKLVRIISPCLLGGRLRRGDNTFGQLGGVSFARLSPPLADIALPAVSYIAAGWFHTCAVTIASGLRCWGRNDAGQVCANAGTHIMFFNGSEI